MKRRSMETSDVLKAGLVCLLASAVLIFALSACKSGGPTPTPTRKPGIVVITIAPLTPTAAPPTTVPTGPTPVAPTHTTQATPAPATPGQATPAPATPIPQPTSEAYPPPPTFTPSAYPSP